MEKFFQSDYQEGFDQASLAVINGCFLTKTSNIITEDAKKELEALVVKSSYNLDMVVRDISNHDYNPERKGMFISMLEQKKPQILQSALISHNSLYGMSAIDFDWSLKVIIGTSERKDIKYPIVQLQLKTLCDSSIVKKKVYEMKIDTLDKLINKLETELQ